MALTFRVGVGVAGPQSWLVRWSATVRDAGSRMCDGRSDGGETKSGAKSVHGRGSRNGPRLRSDALHVALMTSLPALPSTDLHAHIVPPVIAESVATGHLHGVDLGLTSEGRLRADCGGDHAVLPWPDFAEPLAARLALMDAERIDRHVLSLSPLLFWYAAGADDARAYASAVNDSLADVVREAPDRFQAFAYLPLQDPVASAVELERCMAQDAFVGAVVGTNVRGVDWDDPTLEPVLAAAERTGAVLFLHPTRVRGTEFLGRFHLRNLIGNPLETAVAFASLVFSGALDRHPDLDLLLSHGGGFATSGIGRFDHGAGVRDETVGAGAVLPSEYLRRVHVDCLTHSEALLKYLIGVVGADRIVIGTDYPADMGLRDPIGWLETMAWLTPHEREAIVRENASALLGGQVRSSFATT